MTYSLSRLFCFLSHVCPWSSCCEPAARFTSITVLFPLQIILLFNVIIRLFFILSPPCFCFSVCIHVTNLSLSLSRLRKGPVYSAWKLCGVLNAKCQSVSARCPLNTGLLGDEASNQAVLHQTLRGLWWRAHVCATAPVCVCVSVQ